MKKVMLKKPQVKEYLIGTILLGGIYYLAYSTTNSHAIGAIWVAIAALTGALGILAMKVFGTY